MAATATHLKPQAPAVHIGFVSQLSAVLGLIARTLADFNRYMDAGQQVHGHDHIR
jgi:hypothetical protein